MTLADALTQLRNALPQNPELDDGHQAAVRVVVEHTDAHNEAWRRFFEEAKKGHLVVMPNRPNPSIIQNWHCPLCRGTTTDHGVERRRIGRRPWRRLVHISCIEGAQ